MSSTQDAARAGGQSATFPLRTVAAASVVAATLVAFLAHPGGKNAIPVWAIAIMAVTAAAVVFGLVVPRAIRKIADGGRSPAGAVFAFLAVVGLGLFGVGLSLIFGLAAISVGQAQRSVGQRSFLPMAVGAVACVVNLALGVAYYVTGWPGPPR